MTTTTTTIQPPPPPPQRQLFPGAGILPFALVQSNLVESTHPAVCAVLLHRTSQGRKVGYLVDFGGACETINDSQDCQSELEYPELCAAREFAEETAALLQPEEEEEEEETAWEVTSKPEENLGRDGLYSCAEVAKVKEQVQRILNARSNNVGVSVSETTSTPTTLFDSKRMLMIHPVSRYHCYALRIKYQKEEELSEVFNKISLHKRRRFLWVPVEVLLRHNPFSHLAPEAAPGYSDFTLHPRLQTPEFRALLLHLQSIVATLSHHNPKLG